MEEKRLRLAINEFKEEEVWRQVRDFKEIKLGFWVYFFGLLLLKSLSESLIKFFTNIFLYNSSSSIFCL